MSIWERNIKGVVDIPIGTIYGLSNQLISGVQTLVSLYGAAPSTDNAVDLGTSTNRWKDLFLGGRLWRTPIYGYGSRTTNQALAQNTIAFVDIDNQLLPTGFTYSNPNFVNGTGRTVTVLVTVSLQINVAAGSNVMWLERSGASNFRYSQTRGATLSSTSVSVFSFSAILVLQNNESFKIGAFQNTTATADIVGGGGNWSGPHMTFVVL